MPQLKPAVYGLLTLWTGHQFIRGTRKNKTFSVVIFHVFLDLGKGKGFVKQRVNFEGYKDNMHKTVHSSSSPTASTELPVVGFPSSFRFVSPNASHEM